MPAVLAGSAEKGRRASIVPIPMVMNRPTQLRSNPNANETARTVAPVNAAPREPTEEEIRKRAYEIYLERGNNEAGHEAEDWERAARELRERRVRN